MKKSPHLTIKALPPSERPREKLLDYGSKALSNAELLAVILRTGTSTENAIHLAERILSHVGGLSGLGTTTAEHLAKVNGLGPTKITQLLATVELARRLMTFPTEERPIIQRAEDAIALLMDMQHLTQEHVRVILLDSAQRLVTIQTVYIGTVNSSVLRVAEVFREAITRNCPALLLAHNHPAGQPTPSPEDIHLTRTIVMAGRLLDIQVIDHLIIGERDWSSLKNLGLLKG
jgi:DNA repair protein RadC